VGITQLNDLRSYLDVLKNEKQLLVIDEEVDPALEIAEIHRRIIAVGGPALLFTRVKGSDFPVTTNLFGTSKRLELAFGNKPQQFVRDIVRLAESIMPLSLGRIWESRSLILDGLKIGLKTVKNGAVLENLQQPAKLSSLPMLTSWPGTATAAPSSPCRWSIPNIRTARDTTSACTASRDMTM